MSTDLPWVMEQTWENVFFVSWPLEPEALAPRVYGVDYALVRETRRPSSPRRGSG